MGYRDSEEYRAKEKERKRLYNERKRLERQQQNGQASKHISEPAKQRDNKSRHRSANVVGKRKARAERKPKSTGDSRSSLLEAAYQCLGNHSRPMCPQEMVEWAISKGLWTPGKGKTPHATLWARILEEIKRDGRNSRFRKAGPGMFAASGK